MINIEISLLFRDSDVVTRKASFNDLRFFSQQGLNHHMTQFSTFFINHQKKMSFSLLKHHHLILKNDIQHDLLVKNDKDFLNVLLNDHLQSCHTHLIKLRFQSQVSEHLFSFHCCSDLCLKQHLNLILLFHDCRDITIDMHVLLKGILCQRKTRKQFQLEAEKKLSHDH